MRPTVTDRVECLSVSLSVTLVIRAKMAEPIEMSFGLTTQPPMGRGNFEGEGASHYKV